MHIVYNGRGIYFSGTDEAPLSADEASPCKTLSVRPIVQSAQQNQDRPFESIYAGRHKGATLHVYARQ